MCYTRRKIEDGVDALRESDDTNFLKPNGQSRNFNIYGLQVVSIFLGKWSERTTAYGRSVGTILIPNDAYKTLSQF